MKKKKKIKKPRITWPIKPIQKSHGDNKKYNRIKEKIKKEGIEDV